MSDSDFHGSVLDLKVRMSYRRKCTRCKAYTYGTCIVDRLLRSCDYLVKVSALSGLRTAALPHENLARNTAALLSLILGSGSNVIVRYNRLNRKSRLLGHLDGHLYVHVVSGIVSVENRNALALIRSLLSVKECLRCR